MEKPDLENENGFRYCTQHIDSNVGILHIDSHNNKQNENTHHKIDKFCWKIREKNKFFCI